MALTDKLSAIADAIRAKTGKQEAMTLAEMPGEIASITGGGGGSSADVRYVTFMNGDTVLYKKPVAVGDDCVDVLTKGLISTPTKESTAQYNYTYYGWGASDGGAADANILKNITADKTVYAIFTAAVRYYTITYLDDDGVTVLNTQSLAYGATPSYAPKKDGYSFAGWLPNEPVAGDTTYTAVWEEAKSFADLSWEKIAEISESGLAQQMFAVGDEKAIYNDSTGAVYARCRIIGFNHDNLSDGTGKAGITCALVGAHMSSITRTAKDAFGDGVAYPNSLLRTMITSTYLPPNESLRNVVKSVTKKCKIHDGTNASIDDKFWPLSEAEFGTSTAYTDGTKYQYFRNTSNKGIPMGMNYAMCFLRSCMNNYVRRINPTAEGATGSTSVTSTADKIYMHIGFCI